MVSSLYSLSNSSTNSFTFSKFSCSSYVFVSTIYPFHQTRNLSLPCTFLLFKIVSTLYSFSPFITTVTNFIQTITSGILDWFQRSKWPLKALKKTFQTVPKMSQSDQYSLSYQQISQWSPSHQILNHQYLRNCLI